MPFLTEEIWQYIDDRKPEEALIISKWPMLKQADERLISGFETAAEVISGIRTIRKDKNIPFKDTIDMKVLNNEGLSNEFDSIIKKLGNVENLEYTAEKVKGALTFRAGSNEYFIPITGAVDVDGEIAKLTEELSYNKGFLKSVQAKLSNEKFVNNAAEHVVAMERQKEADALAKIATIEQSLASLK
jgi:valyl-tRNA synthetase